MITFTTLTCDRGIATKLYEGTKKVKGLEIASQPSLNFIFEEISVESFDEVVLLLEALQRDPRKFLIRGAPTEFAREQQARGNLIYRRKRAKPDGPATFKSADRAWVFFDIDGLPPPPGVDPTSEEAVRYIISKLSPEFHNTSAWYQFSSSAHVKRDGIRLHLLFLLDRPVSDESTRATMKAWNEEFGSKLIDEALFDSIQAHYTAAPIFGDGGDPLGSRRSGVIRGDRERVSLVLRTPRRAAIPARAAIHAREGGEHDDTGKLIDGREDLLLRIRFAVLMNLEPKTFDEFVQHVWDRFTAKAKLGATPGVSDTTWTFEMVADKCRADWADRGRFKARKPIEGVAPLYPAKPIPLPEAEARLAELVGSYFEAPHDMALRIQAGIGKTRQVCRELARLPAGKIAYVYAPTHALLEEYHDRILEDNPNVRVNLIQGRNEKTCSRHEIVKDAVKTGGPVVSVLCNGRARDDLASLSTFTAPKKTVCPHHETCIYWAQFTKPAEIYLFTTEQLKLPLQREIPPADYIVIDETFFRTMIEHKDVSPSDLQELRKATASQPDSWAAGRVIADALVYRKPLLGELRASWAAHVASVLKETDRWRAHGLPEETARQISLSKIFREPSPRVLGLDADELRRTALRHLPGRLRCLANDIWGAWRNRFFTKTNPAAGDAQLRDLIGQLPVLPKSFRILNELAAELEEAPDREHSLSVVPTAEGAEVRWAADRKRLAGPTLFIDASADETILRLFKPDVEFHRIHDNRMSRSALGRSELVARVQAVLDRILPRYTAPAVFMHKKDRDENTFCLTGPSKPGHYGNVRGLNDWSSCDAAVLIGGYLPNLGVVEREASVLARIGGGNINLVGDWAEALAGVRMRNGCHIGVKSRTHGDPLAAAVLRQHQAEELGQALDRIRAVRAEMPKDIYLLTSVVVDVTVDELVALDELAGTELELLLERFGGLVPLSEEWLTTRAGDLFPSVQSVKDWKRRDLRWQTAIGIYSSLPPYQLHTYRKQGQRGRSSEFVVISNHPLSRTVLEIQVGALSSYDGPPDTPVPPMLFWFKSPQRAIEQSVIWGAGYCGHCAISEAQTRSIYR